MVGYIYLIEHNQITSSSREKFALKIFMVEKFIQQNTFPSVSCAFADVIASFSASVVIMRLSLRRSLRSPGFSSFSSFPSRSPLTRSFTFHFSWRERMEPARIPRRNLRERHFARARARSLSFCAYSYSLIHYHRAAWMRCINEMEITK